MIFTQHVLLFDLLYVEWTSFVKAQTNRRPPCKDSRFSVFSSENGSKSPSPLASRPLWHSRAPRMVSKNLAHGYLPAEQVVKNYLATTAPWDGKLVLFFKAYMTWSPPEARRLQLHRKTFLTPWWLPLIEVTAVVQDNSKIEKVCRTGQSTRIPQRPSPFCQPPTNHYPRHRRPRPSVWQRSPPPRCTGAPLLLDSSPGDRTPLSHDCRRRRHRPHLQLLRRHGKCAVLGLCELQWHGYVSLKFHGTVLDFLNPVS